MESENEVYDITAKQLYDRIESWNKELEKTIKEGKKNKNYYKSKDLLIKLQNYPTPIQNLELIDIKLGNKMKEDDVFLENDFIAENVRRGESLFYNKEENTYEYARFGLPKFFDYKKTYDETEKEQYLKKRVLGKLIEVNEKENKNNPKYFAYLTTKVNGENVQVSYNTKYACWVVASKNVSIAIRNKEDIEFYKNCKNFEAYINDNKDKNKNVLLNEKEKKKKENKEKKLEKKKKKQERIERRKKGKKDDDEDENENENEEEQNENKINVEEENKKDDKKVKNNNLERFTYAIDFAETWLNLLDERIIKNENKNLLDEFKKELGNHTLIGESVGDKKREHILVYQKRDIIFYGIVNNSKLLSQNCLPLSTSFNLFKKYNLSYTEITPSTKFNTLEELYAYMSEQYDIIFDKSLQESGEGNVVYFSCDINGDESVKGLGKLKTFEYRFLRKIREKCRSVPPEVSRAEIEKDVKKLFDGKKKKKKGKKEQTKEEEENEIKRYNKKVDNEFKEKNEERDKKINNLLDKYKRESRDLLKEVPESKYNKDKVLLEDYYNFGDYIINYRAKDDTNYFDVFASFIEIMKEKYKAKSEINNELVNEIKKKFEGLFPIKEANEVKDNEEKMDVEKADEEDPK